MLYLHTSNQLEQLKNQYAAVVKTPLKDVFKAETVVVQNAGMARWLSMEMAQVSGISANTDFLFPAEFMWGLLRLVSPEIPEHSQCAPDTLRFHIFEELTLHSEDYPELHHYILHPKQSGETDENHFKNQSLDQLKTWELSCQSATLLDQYLFYRSEWINTWENDVVSNSSNPNTIQNENQNKHWSNHWQARLWNRCVKDKNLLHWLALQEQFSENIETIDAVLFPERISFFSMSALSPGYVELLEGIAQKTDIHIFIINPCEDIYWGDIQSAKTVSKLETADQTYAEIGNPLLASLGKQGRDFIDKLLDIHDQETSGFVIEDDRESNSLLTQIQHDIYNLEEPVLHDHLSKYDSSIQFNSCHTTMREVEVLHDQILAQLDTDKELAPNDIVVMMPDIEKYAPYIESVFTTDIANNKNKIQKLPFSIADRDPQNIFKIIQALNKLLTLPDSRFDVEAVFELLEYDDIRQHFNLDIDQLNYCRELALSTNIRWGISNKSRRENLLPDTEEHTWKYALDRMLLGYSLSNTNEHQQLFKSKRNLNLLAYTEIEGSNALVLANFKQFTDVVFTINDWRNETLSLEKWLLKTNKLIQQISPESSDQQRIFKALTDLQIKADLADFKQELSFVVFQKMLQQCLADISANEKYLGYGITFCALVPMRSVPFKIVALLGMNDGEFPRQETRLSFDLMAEQKIRGDRSRRDEDRYLFLESILASRSRLIISYIGQSIKDNTDLAPSILVNELLDTVTINTGIEAKDWIVKHPLQAFSSRYFSSKPDEDNPLFSYASQYLQLKNKQSITTLPTEKFITDALETLDDEHKRLSCDELIRFFKNPARIFLKSRFGIQTFDNDKELQNREPFEIEPFKEREIRNQILTNEFSNIPAINDSLLISRAKGLLPYGQIGDEIYAKEKHIIEVFEKQSKDVENYTDRQVLLTVGEFQIDVRLDYLTSLGRYVKQVTKPYAGDYIEHWIKHLCLNVYISSNHDIKLNKASQFHSPEIGFQLNPVDDAKIQLESLLKYYWQGLHYPLPFFPKTGFALFSKNGHENLTDMTNKWNGNDQFSGEKDSFELSLLHKDLVIDKEDYPENFMQINRDLFGKLFTSLSDIV